MNQFTTTLVLALCSAASSVALAEDITIDDTPFVPTLTRAEVKAEVLRARAAGLLRDWLYEHSAYLPAVPEEPVRAFAARKPAAPNGERLASFAELMFGEDSGSFYLSRVQTPAVASEPVLARLER